MFENIDRVRTVSWSHWRTSSRTHRVSLVCGHCHEDQFLGSIERAGRPLGDIYWVAKVPYRPGPKRYGYATRRLTVGRKVQRFATVREARIAILQYHGLPKGMFPA